MLKYHFPIGIDTGGIIKVIAVDSGGDLSEQFHTSWGMIW
jgi:hypothetical protein